MRRHTFFLNPRVPTTGAFQPCNCVIVVMTWVLTVANSSRVQCRDEANIQLFKA